MIANFYGQGQQGLNQQYTQNGQGALQRAYGLQDSATAFARQQALYFQQQNDYNNYLNQQNRQNRQGAFGSLVGGAIGAGAGAYFGGGAGASAGAGIGSRIGSAF